MNSIKHQSSGPGPDNVIVIIKSIKFQKTNNILLRVII